MKVETSTLGTVDLTWSADVHGIPADWLPPPATPANRHARRAAVARLRKSSPWRRLTIAWWDGRAVMTPRERQEQARAR